MIDQSFTHGVLTHLNDKVTAKDIVPRGLCLGLVSRYRWEEVHRSATNLVTHDCKAYPGKLLWSPYVAENLNAVIPAPHPSEV